MARQLLTEGLVISVLGAALGVGLSLMLVRILTVLRPADLPRFDSVSVDGPALLFSGLVSVAVALVIGLVPLVTSGRAEAGALLRDRGTGAGARAGASLRRILVVGELAVSVILLAGAGLLLRSFAALSHVDDGVDTTGAVAVDVAVPFFEYRDDAARSGFFVELARRANELPGVSAAGVTSRLPLEPGTGGTGYAAWSPDGAVLDPQVSPQARYRSLTPGALTAMGVTFREGRDFEARDEIQGSVVTVVVDARIAQQFPDGAIGRTVRVAVAGYTGEDAEVDATIVGVIAPVRFGKLAQPDEPTIFLPYRMFAPVDGTLLVRTNSTLKAD